MSAPVERANEKSPEAIPALPAEVWTRTKECVALSGPVWRFRLYPDLAKHTSLNWVRFSELTVAGTARPVISPRALHILQLFIADRARTHQASSLQPTFTELLRFVHYLATTPIWLVATRPFEWSDLTFDMADAFRAAELETKTKGLCFNTLRYFYRWGTEVARLSDFTMRTLHLLQTLKAEKASSGWFVRLRDPRRGPFDADEVYAIRRAFADNKGEERDRAIGGVLLHTAIRPVQLARLKNRHLQRFSSATGTWHQLKVPKGKQVHTEEDYLYFKLAPALAELLERVRNPDPDPDALLFHWLKGDYGQAIREALTRLFDAADLRSARLPSPWRAVRRGDPEFQRMPSNPYRFRYTLATHLIEQGASPAYVARNVLGHADLQSIQIYVEMRPSIADVFQKASDPKLKPFVQRMMGTLEDPEHPSNHPLVGGDLAQLSRQRDLRVLGAIGKCAADGHCRFNPVTGCYGCESFIALPDGPHEALRDAIREDLEHEMAHRSSPRILQMLTDTLHAMEEWIAHIAAVKAGLQPNSPAVLLTSPKATPA